MERRRYTRVDLKTGIFIYDGKDIVSGCVNNISLGGLFLETDKKFYKNQMLDIIIIISNDGSHLSLKIKGVVTRTEKNGIALEFFDLDMDTFILLSKYISDSTEYAV